MTLQKQQGAQSSSWEQATPWQVWLLDTEEPSAHRCVLLRLADYLNVYLDRDVFNPWLVRFCFLTDV